MWSTNCGSIDKAPDSAFILQPSGSLPLFFNIVGFYASWFGCVLGAALGMEWLGPAIVAVFLAVHLARFARPGEGRFLLLITAAGFVIDSAQAAAGLLRFPGGGWLCPIWLLALWPAFGATLHLALNWMRDRPVLAAVFGAIGGPLSYWSGARLGAIELHPDLWPSILSVGLVWATAMPLLFRLRLSPPAAP